MVREDAGAHVARTDCVDDGLDSWHAEPPRTVRLEEPSARVRLRVRVRVRVKVRVKVRVRVRACLKEQRGPRAISHGHHRPRPSQPCGGSSEQVAGCGGGRVELRQRCELIEIELEHIEAARVEHALDRLDGS
jgi:hypothetical protein